MKEKGPPALRAATPRHELDIESVKITMILNFSSSRRVAVSLLPYPWSSKLAGLERYGFFILIFLLATGLLGAILSPLIRVSQNIILTIFG